MNSVKLNQFFSAFIVTLSFILLHACDSKDATLTIDDLGKNYDYENSKLIEGMYFHIPSEEVNHGNTSIRNTDEENLLFKDHPDKNGYGYFQRNRDMGQIFNIPEGQHVKINSIVLRTSLGSKALMDGTADAELYLVFFEVDTTDAFAIDNNGTGKGDSATHGFDHQYNRCDDFIVGDQYSAIKMFDGGIFPKIAATTQPGHPTAKQEPFGEQAGHLRYLRFKLGDGIELDAGKRYAFLVGFKEPADNRGIAFAITTEVHQKEPAEFVRDVNGKIKWGIRREGNGTYPPTMYPGPEPPADKEKYQRLINESLFPENHYTTLKPGSEGYPDVDTYRTMQYYIEVE